MTHPVATLADTWQASVEKLPYSPVERGLWDDLKDKERASPRAVRACACSERGPAA